MLSPLPLKVAQFSHREFRKNNDVKRLLPLLGYGDRDVSRDTMKRSRDIRIHYPHYYRQEFDLDESRGIENGNRATF